MAGKKKAIEDILECQICSERFTNLEGNRSPRILACCSNTFCAICVQNIIMTQQTCPYCRSSIDTNSVKDLPVDRTILKLLDSLANSLQESDCEQCGKNLCESCLQIHATEARDKQIHEMLEILEDQTMEATRLTENLVATVRETQSRALRRLATRQEELKQLLDRTARLSQHKKLLTEEELFPAQEELQALENALDLLENRTQGYTRRDVSILCKDSHHNIPQSPFQRSASERLRRDFQLTSPPQLPSRLHFTMASDFKMSAGIETLIVLPDGRLAAGLKRGHIAVYECRLIQGTPASAMEKLRVRLPDELCSGACVGLAASQQYLVAAVSRKAVVSLSLPNFQVLHWTVGNGHPDSSTIVNPHGVAIDAAQGRCFVTDCRWSNGQKVIFVLSLPELTVQARFGEYLHLPHTIQLCADGEIVVSHDDGISVFQREPPFARRRKIFGKKTRHLAVYQQWNEEVLLLHGIAFDNWQLTALSSQGRSLGQMDLPFVHRSGFLNITVGMGLILVTDPSSDVCIVLRLSAGPSKQRTPITFSRS